MASPILFERDGDVAIITLNETAKLNALSLDLQRELRARLADIRADRTVRALLLTGAGKAFSVGADLSTEGPMSPGTPGLGQRTADLMHELSNRIVTDLRELPVPVVVALNGAAAGAGVGIALAADVVVAARSAYFYLPFVPKLGLLPDLGATWFLTRLLGRARATALTLLGERLAAQTAAEWGLIWSCVDDEQLRAQALSLAQRLARLPAARALDARRAFDAAAGHTLDQQLDYETTRQRELLDAPEFAEGVRAFLERREPVFGSR
ncbi:enoyl-CoA hydratase-related protein [Paraburkholderia bannensis]|uniref:enoyl-CoA hydratase-related protein n=1 Tax=Paraburkholderia bannensis TaxID=765414 RepID=UPI002AB65AAA|nr:enoyl-CoA hydratase-related protein [Paraburkholderia bannensis]